MAIPERIARRLEGLPNAPGVYLWKDRSGTVLYVGKAKRLKQRVRSHFSAEAAERPRQRMLLRDVADVETIVVPSESQALLLENNLIKEYRPRYNILLRDDKSYPRIAVTLQEPFPRVLVVRRLDIPGARFFGPYTDVTALRRTLRIIRRLFTVRSCHYGLPTDAPDRPCLDYHIDRCLAPCVGYQRQAEYRSMIGEVLAFLEGKTVEVRTRLRQRMEDASGRLEYERAASIRDALQWLEQLEQPAAVEFVGGGDIDAIGMARDGDDAVGVTLRIRGGRLLALEHRFLENVGDAADPEILSAYLVRHYVPAEGRARQAVLPFAPEALGGLRELLPDTRWSVPQRGLKHRVVQLAEQNARNLMESFRIESFETDERAEDPVYALGRDLGLTIVPRSLVCIDISTSQGRDTVGSLVWFEAGRPKKSEYRKYKIKEIVDDKPDDYAAIREVVTRFVRRRVDEEKPLPDLMVIDGGKGQLAAARDAMAAQGVTGLALASLAKREEEVFVPDRGDAIRLAARAPSLKLLQRARDEAHRTAVSFTRVRRSARTVTSELLAVPGIGETRRRTLLTHFGSLAAVRLATVEEIAALPGFSTTLADRVLSHLRS